MLIARPPAKGAAAAGKSSGLEAELAKVDSGRWLRRLLVVGVLAALIGGAAAGVPGALVATPLVGAAKSVWLDVHGSPGATGTEVDDDDSSSLANQTSDD